MAPGSVVLEMDAGPNRHYSNFAMRAGHTYVSSTSSGGRSSSWSRAPRVRATLF